METVQPTTLKYSIKPEQTKRTYYSHPNKVLMFRRRPTVPAPVVKSAPIQTAPIPVTPPNISTFTPTTITNGTSAINGAIIGDRYRLEKTIGKGSYGKVKLANDTFTSKSVAVKFISRSSIKKPAHMTRIRREINLLTALNHQNIVRLESTLENSTDIILVMEFVGGLDLFERIVKHPSQRYSEFEARPIFEQLAAAVEYCHHNRVIHRDLKPENVMVDDSGRVKLIDFGFASTYHPRGYLETNCGSPLYAAPEIVQGVKYVGPEVDIWSLGVILYAMLAGCLPFEDEQLKGLYSKICSGNYKTPEYFSESATDLIKSMLNIDPRQRATISQVARHPWFLIGRNSIQTRQIFSRTCCVPYPEEPILQGMISFGYNDVDILKSILRNDPDDPATAMYHLLREKYIREQKEIDKRKRIMEPKGVLLTPPSTPLKSGQPCRDIKDDWVSYAIPSDFKLPLVEQLNQKGVNREISLSSNGGSTTGNIVSQAAATVANHFKKLRKINLLHTNGEAKGSEYQSINSPPQRQQGYMNV